MRIIPSRQASFKDMWEPLRELQDVYIPYCKKEDLKLPDTSDDPLCLALDDAPMVLSRLAWKNENNERFGLLVTDLALIDHPFVYLALSPAKALERFFHSTREIMAVVFNGSSPYVPKNSENTFGWAARRFFLPRLIGMLQSQEPFPQDLSAHKALSIKALEQDQIYTAIHHAAFLRENAGSLDDYYFTESEALFYLALNDELVSYFNWYEERGGTDQRHKLLKARLLTCNQKFLEAEALLASLDGREDLRPGILLERGRSMLMQGKAEEAAQFFADTLRMHKENYDAWLGKGIALRAMHFKSGNATGLAQSLMCFEHVAALSGYHASEALHHAGTIHGRIEDWAKAEQCYRQTLRLRESPVSRRNLVLALAAQREMHEARREYQMLIEIDAQMGEGLERYITPQISVVNQDELLSKKAAEATARLKEWSIPVQGDILDFRRIDEYLNYHAPGGQFLESTAFHGMSPDNVSEVTLLIALHLAGVLVEKGHAKWVPDSKGNLYNVAVSIEPDSVYPVPLALFSTVHNRLLVGAEADNMSNLDFLVSLLPEYLELNSKYSTPIEITPCSEGELTQFRKSADTAREMALDLGFPLKGDISDLTILDQMIEQCLLPDGRPASYSVADIVGDQPRLFIIGLGLHLGFLWKRFTDARWFSHPALSGISLKAKPMNPFYPVQRVFGRVASIGSGESISELRQLEYSLVSCELIKKVIKNELTTRDEVAKLLMDALPEIKENDPSGQAIERMVTLITSQAGKSLV